MKIPENIKFFGDPKYRGACGIEDNEQKMVFGWLKECRPELYSVAIHPKNEGKRSMYQIKKERLLGSLNKGASDVVIPARIAFVCELKRRNRLKSSITNDQINYLLAAEKLGAFACIALGADAFKLAVFEWEKLLSESIKNG